MCDKKPMFADAKKGDVVWSFTGGWCSIEDTDNSQTYPIRTTHGNSYTLDGTLLTTHKNPSLFWDEIKFEIPPRPKRKVKNVLRGWVNVYLSGKMDAYVHSTKEDADKGGMDGRGRDCRIACVEINQEYEVEE